MSATGNLAQYASATDAFAGVIDDLAMWARSLTADEVYSVAQSNQELGAVFAASPSPEPVPSPSPLPAPAPPPENPTPPPSGVTS